MTDDLDTRARAAAAALHESVRGLSAAPVPPPRRLRLVAAAVLVVMAVAAVVVLLAEGPDSTDVVTDDAGDVPRLLLDPAPTGLLSTGVADLPLAEDPGVTEQYWVYGDPDASNPFAEGDLGVVISTGPDATFQPPDDAREVEIDGMPAWIATSSDPLERRSVGLDVADGTIAYIASSTLSDDELVAAVTELDLGSGTASAPSGAAGLDLVAVSTAGATGTIPLPLPTNAGHIAGYQTEDDALNKVIVVASVAGGEDAYLVARWALGPTSRAITVRETEGWVGAPYGDTSTILVWRESPTNLVALSAFGLGESATLAAAESLRSATEEEWAALVTATGQVPIPSSARAAVSGEEPDGRSWAAYLDNDGSLCLDVETADGSTGSCSSGGSAPLEVVAGDLSDGQVVVYGYTTLGTDGAVRITADGEPAGSEAYYEDGTVFAFTVPADRVPAEIIVLGPDGTELGRATVPAPESAPAEGTATTMSG